MQIWAKLQEFNNEMQNNYQFRYTRIYMNMIERLFTFIRAKRSRNWYLYLSALKDIIPDIMSMDRIKYRRVLPVYLGVMNEIEHSDPKVWKFMQDCIQKNKIQFTALVLYQAYEQENTVSKVSHELNLQE